MPESGKQTTILGTDVTLDGTTLRFVGDVHLYGSVSGDIASSTSVVIAEGGRLDGNVQAESVQIAGALSGDAHCQRFDIQRSGVVDGTIFADRWTVEPGAVVDAEFVHPRRAELTKNLADVERAYRQALANVEASGGAAQGASSGYADWVSRVRNADGPPDSGPGSKRPADPDTIGRAAWSKSVASADPSIPGAKDLFEEPTDT